MTKEQLKEKVKELTEKVEELENDVDYWVHEYDKIDEQLNDAIKQLTNYNGGIKDIDNFIWKLKLDNLYTEKIEQFITDYLNFYNK